MSYKYSNSDQYRHTGHGRALLRREYLISRLFWIQNIPTMLGFRNDEIGLSMQGTNFFTASYVAHIRHKVKLTDDDPNCLLDTASCMLPASC